MKRNYWPLFFISIFSFTLGMIIWTISSAIKVPVQEDESFLVSYHDLDRDFNNIVASNEKFLKKYDFTLSVNDRDFPLIIKDIFASQRVLEEKSKHKRVLNIGKNTIVLKVKDKKTNELKDIKISLRVTRSTNHSNTMDFYNENFVKTNGAYNLGLDLPLKGNWNITGNFEVDSDKGYFYIKTSAL